MTPTKKEAVPGIEGQIVAMTFELEKGWHWIDHGWRVAQAVRD